MNIPDESDVSITYIRAILFPNREQIARYILISAATLNNPNRQRIVMKTPNLLAKNILFNIAAGP